MKMIVGNTGFVGGNIYASGEFDTAFHSTNIEQAYGLEPDLLVYAGLRAEKYLANSFPDKDYNAIEQAYANIVHIKPKKVVLISTIDVYKHPVDVDEDTVIETAGLHPYGYNRYRLEQMICDSGIDSLIIRLPGLYGEGLKKNFLYDIIHRIPSMLTAKKFAELYAMNSDLGKAYEIRENGFYQLKALEPIQRKSINAFFETCGFNALHFTDSRSLFQMYPLRFLWKHIQMALAANLCCLNIAVEPVYASEIFENLYCAEFKNILERPIANYRMRTKHDSLFSGKDGYIFDKAFLLDDIIHFLRVNIDKLG